VADLEAEIPQHVEQVFCYLLAERGLLVGQHEQQIDVGAGSQCAAAIAADRHHRHPLAGTEIGSLEHMPDRIVVDLPHDHVLDRRQPAGTEKPAAVFEERIFDRCPGVGESLLQQRQDLQPRSRRGPVRAIARGDLGEAAAQRLDIEDAGEIDFLDVSLDTSL
jgi:hypothetical protein